MQNANNCKHVSFETHLNHGKFYLEIQTIKFNPILSIGELMTFEIDQLLGL